MSNTLIVHIGTPKTGTSALQKFLADNALHLKKRGWCYPDIEKDWGVVSRQEPVKSPKNGARLKLSIAQKWPGWKKDVLWKIIINYLKYHNVILSDEGLWSYPTLNFEEAMREIKSRYDKVKIICYLRRQDLYIESKWNQDVKAGFFCEDVWKYYELKKEEFDYKTRLEQLAEIFGKENVIARVYEKGQFVGVRNDITSDFLEVCGIGSDWDEVNMPGSVNERIDNDVLGLKYLFNKEYLESFDKSEGKPSGQLMIEKHFRKMKINEKNAKMGYISEEMRIQILDKYAEGNKYVAREYLGKEELFHDMDVSIPLYSPEFTQREEQIVKLFAKVIAEQEKKQVDLRNKNGYNFKIVQLFQKIGGIRERFHMVNSVQKLDFK